MVEHEHKWQYAWQGIKDDVLWLHFVCECGKIKVIEGEELVL